MFHMLGIYLAKGRGMAFTNPMRSQIKRNMGDIKNGEYVFV